MYQKFAKFTKFVNFTKIIKFNFTKFTSFTKFAKFVKFIKTTTKLLIGNFAFFRHENSKLCYVKIYFLDGILTFITKNWTLWTIGILDY